MLYLYKLRLLFSHFDGMVVLDIWRQTRRCLPDDVVKDPGWEVGRAFFCPDRRLVTRDTPSLHLHLTPASLCLSPSLLCSPPCPLSLVPSPINTPPLLSRLSPTSTSALLSNGTAVQWDQRAPHWLPPPHRVRGVYRTHDASGQPGES